MYTGCPNCGYSEHISHGSEYCPRCGTKLIGPVVDTREICPEDRRAAYENLRKAQKAFRQAGGKEDL
jgi:hypothetical protein